MDVYAFIDIFRLLFSLNMRVLKMLLLTDASIFQKYRFYSLNGKIKYSNFIWLK